MALVLWRRKRALRVGACSILRFYMKKIVYLPLDERPCNFSYTSAVSEGNGYFSLVAPELSDMGVKKTPADHGVIRSFLVRECADADQLVIALDTLLYGGIIPSRLHYIPRDELCERLSVLKELKAANPSMHVSAFSLVMRCPCYTDSSEEPDYYAICGREIFLWGQNEHKHRLGEITDAEYEAERARLAICEPYIPDYEARRAANIDSLVDALEMVGEYIDEFTILQDDSNARGYTAMDRERVLEVVKRRGIDLDTYPGADEGGLTLLGRAATEIEKKSPKIYVAYPREGAESVTPIYEDRAIKHTLSAQIRSAGATECFSENEADIVLFVNLNDERTYDVFLSPEGQSDESYIPAFVSRIRDTLASGKGAAVADVAYCNSGDLTFALELERQIGFDRLWGYAGWNTASNTIGTVMCQAVLRYLYGDTPTHRRFTAYRFMDDVVYSADVRMKLRREGYGRDLGTRGKVSELIERLINERTRELFPRIAERYEATECYLPWQRLFEIGIKIKER